MWTNRTKEWVDVNVKPVCKACFNHRHCFFPLLGKETHTSQRKSTVWKESFSSLIFIRNHEITNLSCQCLIKHTLNTNLCLRRLNNIKEVMHLQRVVIRLSRTHHSQSVFSCTDKTIARISLGEKQSSAQVQRKQHHKGWNTASLRCVMPFSSEWWALEMLACYPPLVSCCAILWCYVTTGRLKFTCISVFLWNKVFYSNREHLIQWKCIQNLQKLSTELLTLSPSFKS